MASGVIFSESFGWAAAVADLTAAATGKWSRQGTSTNPLFGTSFGRISGVTKGVKMDQNGSNGSMLEKDLPANYAELTVGWAMQVTTLSATCRVMGFWESSTEHANLQLGSAGTLVAQRAGTNLTGGGGTTNISTGAPWVYCWMRVLISDAGGTFKTIINGATEYSLTSQDTRNGGTGIINRLRLGQSTGGTGTIYNMSDIVVINCAVNAIDKLADDLRVEYLGPNADGNYNTAWPANIGGSRFGAIDEIPPNSDTDYVEAAAVNDLVSVGLSDPLGSSGTVWTMVPWYVAKKTDAGAGSIGVGLRQNATDVLGATVALSTAYQHLMGDPRDVAPDGSAWDYTKVGSTEWLAKRIA